MMTIKISFVIFCLTNFAATVSSEYHCCQNELCPIDCVRCDGKPTCYDLSDELGCSNETDKRLLSYEKPPVFVPTILAVLKAQLRREKVELSYRFPDRNCFEPVTSSPITTTETPAWLQLLIKLKESLGITTKPTTTTTEMPIWKMLLNKLRAEERGEVYTITPPTKQWVKVYKTTTPVYKPSQTPPWRRTAVPPITESPMTKDHPSTNIPYQTSTTGFVDQTTSISNAQDTINGKEEATTESLKQATSAIMEAAKSENKGIITTTTLHEIATKSKGKITTLMQNKTTTEMRDQTTTMTTEPATSEEMTTNDELTSTTDTVTPGTVKQTVFFTTPHQQIVTKLNQQEIVTPIAPRISTLNDSDTTTSAAYHKTTSDRNNSENVSFVEDMTPLHYTITGNETNNSSFVTGSGEISVNVNVETETLRENVHSNVTNITEVSTQKIKTSTTTTPNLPLETNSTIYANFNQSNKHLDKKMTSPNSSDIMSVTTDLPLFLATADFGVTISTEYAKTVTESETPAPLPKKVISTARERELLSDNMNVSFTNDDSLLNWNKFRGLQGPKYENADDNGQTYVKTSEFVKNVLKNDNGNDISSNVSEPTLKSDISEVNMLVGKLLANYSNSNVSLLSGNLTSSDFIYPSLETKMKEKEKERLNYDVIETKESLPDKSDSGYTLRETSILGFETYNNSNNKDIQSNNTPAVNRDDSIAVSIVKKQSKVMGTLKDRVATSSLQINPENEVRIMLGKLNALVRKALDSSNARSKLVMKELNLARAGTNMVHNTKTESSGFGIQATKSPTFAVQPPTTKRTEGFRMQPTTKSPIFSIQPTTRTHIEHYPQILQSQNVPSQNIRSQDLESKHLQTPKVRHQSIQPLFNLPQVRKPEITTPSSVNKPPVIPQPVKQSNVVQPATVPHIPGNTATISPWWQQTTLSPFSLDNLFGYTTQPSLIDNSWFNPTTSAFSWDAMFGAGGMPVTHVATVSPFNPNQDILNNIYDPLSPDIHVQNTAVNQHMENFGVGTFTTPFLLPSSSFGRIMPSTPQIRPTREVRSRVPTDSIVDPNGKLAVESDDKPTTKAFISYNIHTTVKPKAGNVKTQETTPKTQTPQWNPSTVKPYKIKTAKPSTKTYIASFSTSTPKPFILRTENPSSKVKTNSQGPLEIFKIFNTKGGLQKPGNFSIATQPEKVTEPLLIKPSTKYNLVSKGFDTTTSRTVLPLGTLQPPVIALQNKQDVKTVYDESKPSPATPMIQSQTTITPRLPVTSIIQTFWKTGDVQPTTLPPVTVAVPTSIGSLQTQPSTNFYWNQGQSRVLPSDMISNWWEQVQPTAAPTVFVTQQTPTPTAVSSLDQCYQMQDNTGFCQSRNSGHYKNPADCRSFYVCIWGILHNCACPSSTMFDDNIKVCNWDHLVTCK
ncbi:mucin-2-like [Ruditapes philippinarum]|uniref:mucin-2-like n=1 Tax=Ruditapes philippinarum TaxID=129788 RepID=UPI00295AC3AD|nr:mucin-2-like [Ruditapes philippinarum]